MIVPQVKDGALRSVKCPTIASLCNPRYSGEVTFDPRMLRIHLTLVFHHFNVTHDVQHLCIRHGNSL